MKALTNTIPSTNLRAGSYRIHESEHLQSARLPTGRANTTLNSTGKRERHKLLQLYWQTETLARKRHVKRHHSNPRAQEVRIWAGAYGEHWHLAQEAEARGAGGTVEDTTEHLSVHSPHLPRADRRHRRRARGAIHQRQFTCRGPKFNPQRPLMHMRVGLSLPSTTETQWIAIHWTNLQPNVRVCGLLQRRTLRSIHFCAVGKQGSKTDIDCDEQLTEEWLAGGVRGVKRHVF